MTKKDLAQALADGLGIPQSTALRAVQLVLDAITDTRGAEGRLELRNFGVFEVKQRQPRQGRNPHTGEPVQVPARRVVTFKPGREMEERVGQLKKVPGGRAPARTPCNVAE